MLVHRKSPNWLEEGDNATAGGQKTAWNTIAWRSMTITGGRKSAWGEVARIEQDIDDVHGLKHL